MLQNSKSMSWMSMPTRMDKVTFSFHPPCGMDKKKALLELFHADLRSFMPCVVNMRFSYSLENLAVIAYKRCDLSHEILPCPLEMSLHQKTQLASRRMT